MRTIKFGIFFFLLFTVITARPQYIGGIKAGPNLSTQSVDDSSVVYSFRFGYQVGVFGQWVSDQFSLQPEVYYSQQGATIHYQDQVLYTKLRYLNIPVLFKYNINGGFRVMAGPQLGILLCARSNYHPITKEPYKEQIYTTAYKKTDFALAFGAGWESDMGILVDLRYNLGLTDVSNFAGVPATRNRVIELSVGYLFLRKENVAE